MTGRHRRPSNPWWWPYVAVLAILASGSIAGILGVSIAWWVYSATH